MSAVAALAARMHGAHVLLGGVVRGQWRRGSTWRVGLAHLDPLSGRLRPLQGRGLAFYPELLSGDSSTLVADPFVLFHQGAYFLFFEGMGRDGTGDIRVARSHDRRKWEYLGVAVREPHHLSYPSVHVLPDRTVMVVESSATSEIRIYDVDRFPLGWTPREPLLAGQPFADPTIFRHGNIWWLLTEVSGGSHNRLNAYWTTDDQWGSWQPHARNPVASGAQWSRPGGTPFVDEQGMLVRFGQDCTGRYGQRVAMLEVSALSPTEYEERFRAWVHFEHSPPAWAALRQHHVSPYRVEGHDVEVVVDGRGWLTVIQVARSRAMALGRRRRRDRCADVDT